MAGLVERRPDSLIKNIRAQREDLRIKAAQQLARQRKVTLHLGSPALRQRRRVANLAVIAGDNGVVFATYYKIFLVDEKLPNGGAGESRGPVLAGSISPLLRKRSHTQQFSVRKADSVPRP